MNTSITEAGAQADARLLVVEDEPNILELLSASLRYAGFDVITASAGTEAVQAAQRHRPDLIVLDVMLPDMDGFDVIRRLRGGGARIPVVFLTARDGTDDKIRVQVQLSPTEFKLLRYFMSNANRVLSKMQILDHVWDYDFRGDTGIVESYVSVLRRKIDTKEPRLIHTLRGVGYVLRLPAS
jgi:two-component system OmpR family response regulator